MKRKQQTALICFVLILMVGAFIPLSSYAGTKIVVRTVLASQGEEYTDSQLSHLIGELKSVFRYSSYRLLSEDRIQPDIGKTGSVSLPDNRVMQITPIRIEGDRIELRLVLSKQERQIFQTVFQLLNHSSITVGGPRYQDGYLLFNISGSF